MSFRLRQRLFCLMRQKHCWSLFSFSEHNFLSYLKQGLACRKGEKSTMESFTQMYRRVKEQVDKMTSNINSQLVQDFVCEGLDAGPALASAGPDWKHFCGAPVSGVYMNF